MAGSAAITVPTEARLRELAEFDGNGAPVVSFYLDTDGRRWPRRTEFERAATDLLKAIPTDGLTRDARVSLEADVQRLADYVRTFDRSGVRGVAVFACGPRGLFESFPLPVTVRSRAVADRHPHVLRLEAVVARAERFLTAIVSRDKARIFTTLLGETVERTEILDEVPRKHSQGGWSQANYARHIDELAHKHFKHVADFLFGLSKKEPFDHLVLSGPEEVLAGFEKTLHAWLVERIAARVSLPLTASSADVAEAAAAVEGILESERAADAIGRILEEFAAGRNAVVGLMPTLGALSENRVDVLALSDGEPRPGFRCSSCARLAVEGGACPSCAAPVGPVADLQEEMVDEALRHGVRVVSAETRPLPDGVGALLRF